MHSRPKNLVKSNKSISRNFFHQLPFFCNFKNGQKSIFALEKSLKRPKMQFHEKKFDLFDFTSFFFACTFWAHCAQLRECTGVHWQWPMAQLKLWGFLVIKIFPRSERPFKEWHQEIQIIFGPQVILRFLFWHHDQIFYEMFTY